MSLDEILDEAVRMFLSKQNLKTIRSWLLSQTIPETLWSLIVSQVNLDESYILQNSGESYGVPRNERPYLNWQMVVDKIIAKFKAILSDSIALSENPNSGRSQVGGIYLNKNELNTIATNGIFGAKTSSVNKIKNTIKTQSKNSINLMLNTEIQAIKEAESLKQNSQIFNWAYVPKTRFAQDTRDICAPYQGKWYKIPEDVDQLPHLPNHPRCKCQIIWLKEKT
jgi:hypothetical protein